MGQLPEKCVQKCKFLQAEHWTPADVRRLAANGGLRTVWDQDASECPTPGPAIDKETGEPVCHIAVKDKSGFAPLCETYRHLGYIGNK